MPRCWFQRGTRLQQLTDVFRLISQQASWRLSSPLGKSHAQAQLPVEPGGVFLIPGDIRLLRLHDQVEKRMLSDNLQTSQVSKQATQHHSPASQSLGPGAGPGSRPDQTGTVLCLSLGEEEASAQDCSEVFCFFCHHISYLCYYHTHTHTQGGHTQSHRRHRHRDMNTETH